MVFYRTVMVDGLSIFYREAGRPDAPTLLLLHGFPSSSRMYEPLLTRLSTYYHLVAPDYPGFGHSDAPGAKAFSYTFDHIAQVMEHFTEALGLDRYALYMQDYGGPVGFRLAISHPERVQALIIQNAVAHDEGLGPLWQKRREFWADRAANEAGLRANFSSFAATKQRHVGSNPDPETLDPDRWTDEFAFLSRPGEDDIQIDLFYDYRTNVTNYPAWGAWLRLFLGRRPNAYIVGLEVSESEALLDALWAHATQPRFAMCHEWKVGDVLMWNNLSVLHRRDPFDPKTRRVMHRSQIKGNERIT
jgi:pimeloyl-ACP methyl ester carboxylesterase